MPGLQWKVINNKCLIKWSYSNRALTTWTSSLSPSESTVCDTRVFLFDLVALGAAAVFFRPLLLLVATARADLVRRPPKDKKIQSFLDWCLKLPPILPQTSINEPNIKYKSRYQWERGRLTNITQGIQDKNNQDTFFRLPTSLHLTWYIHNVHSTHNTQLISMTHISSYCGNKNLYYHFITFIQQFLLNG